MQVLSYTRALFQNSSYLQPCKNKFNHKHWITITEGKMFSSWIENLKNRRSVLLHETEKYKDKIFSIACASLLLYSSKVALRRVPVFLKGHSMNIVKHCAEQCEFIVAHRIRRSQQIISLYTKLWDDVALKQFVSRLRRKLIKRGKYLLLASGAMFNWDQERITEEEILKHHNELDVIKDLQKKKYCRKDTEGGKCTCFNCLEPNELEWDIYIEKENLVVWKKEDTNHIGEGLYCYKMYGRYDDVTALNFLEVQVDLDYRLTWDDHAVKLYTIDTERSTHSDVIYWETKWPVLFNNRDYVFKRRYYVDRQRNLVTLVNKSAQHPSAPTYSNKQRITEYWSYMVIKPYTDLDKPGIEFSLTYFDNPGIQVPSTLSSYVTITGMPLFLKRLHDAALLLDSKRKGPSILEEDDQSDGKSKPPSSSGDKSPTKEPANKCPGLPRMYYEKLRDNVFIF